MDHLKNRNEPVHPKIATFEVRQFVKENVVQLPGGETLLDSSRQKEFGAQQTEQRRALLDVPLPVARSGIPISQPGPPFALR